MNKASILTPNQKNFLDVFRRENKLKNKFYLSGGTALANYYIPYRLSEDLDFFSEKEFIVDSLVVFVRSLKNKLNFLKYEYNSSFNRNLFFLSFKGEVFKVEFTYFPFSQVNPPKEIDGVLVDSIMDIAVNKIFTIYQNPRSRDFTDVYMICKKYNFSVGDLIAKAKIKFDWHVDPLKLGSQFLLARELKDYPVLLEPIDQTDWQDFFVKEAMRLKTEIIK